MILAAGEQLHRAVLSRAAPATAGVGEENEADRRRQAGQQQASPAPRGSACPPLTPADDGRTGALTSSSLRLRRSARRRRAARADAASRRAADDRRQGAVIVSATWRMISSSACLDGLDRLAQQTRPLPLPQQQVSTRRRRAHSLGWRRARAMCVQRCGACPRRRRLTGIAAQDQRRPARRPRPVWPARRPRHHASVAKREQQRSARRRRPGALRRASILQLVPWREGGRAGFASGPALSAARQAPRAVSSAAATTRPGAVWSSGERGARARPCAARRSRVGLAGDEEGVAHDLPVEARFVRDAAHVVLGERAAHAADGRARVSAHAHSWRSSGRSGTGMTPPAVTPASRGCPDQPARARRDRPGDGRNFTGSSA